MQALKELSSFVIVDGIAQKIRQKFLRNLRVRILHFCHIYFIIVAGCALAAILCERRLVFSPRYGEL